MSELCRALTQRTGLRAGKAAMTQDALAAVWLRAPPWRLETLAAWLYKAGAAPASAFRSLRKLLL